MATFVTSSTLPKPKAREVTLDLFDIIIPFGRELYRIKHTFQLQNALSEMTSIRNNVRNKVPLQHTNVLDAQFRLFVKQIISFRPSISPNLREFWNAQLDMMTISEKKGKHYNPAKYAMKNKEKIMTVNLVYEKAVTRFKKNQDDEVLLYALLFAHILRIEAIEYSFLSDFNEILRYFGLSKKYDAEKIFSVKRKVQRGWIKGKKTKKKQRDWRTDGRAVRDCLGHNAYELDFSRDPWKIKFNNTKKGFEYKKSFDRDSFVNFMNSADLIYRSSLMLLFTIFALTLCKQHLL